MPPLCCLPCGPPLCWRLRLVYGQPQPINGRNAISQGSETTVVKIKPLWGKWGGLLHSPGSQASSMERWGGPSELGGILASSSSPRKISNSTSGPPRLPDILDEFLGQPGAGNSLWSGFNASDSSLAPQPSLGAYSEFRTSPRKRKYGATLSAFTWYILFSGWGAVKWIPPDLLQRLHPLRSHMLPRCGRCSHLSSRRWRANSIPWLRTHSLLGSLWSVFQFYGSNWYLSYAFWLLMTTSNSICDSLNINLQWCFSVATSKLLKNNYIKNLFQIYLYKFLKDEINL